jgi:hypothetical protein
MQEIKNYKDGTSKYYWNGRLHREDGPAIEWSHGTKEWYLHGKCHREDGPAIEWTNGDKYWYLQGKQYSEQEYWRRVKLKALW